MFELQATLRTRTWQMPFATPRRMTIYGGLQEMATFVIYCRQEARAKAEGDAVLAKIFRFIARDEIEHAHFYQDVVRALLEEDREGTLADLAYVTAHFEMPGVGLVPDYDARVEVMRQAGIDRALFLRKVFLPMLTHLGVDRAEVVRAVRRDGEPTAIFPAQACAPPS
jgi:acyl-[acyl-carrier-protein] desaturase